MDNSAFFPFLYFILMSLILFYSIWDWRGDSLWKMGSASYGIYLVTQGHKSGRSPALQYTECTLHGWEMSVKNSLFSLISRPVLTYLSMVLALQYVNPVERYFRGDLYSYIYAYPLCVGPVSIHEHGSHLFKRSVSTYGRSCPLWVLFHVHPRYMSPIPCEALMP